MFEPLLPVQISLLQCDRALLLLLLQPRFQTVLLQKIPNVSKTLQKDKRSGLSPLTHLHDLQRLDLAASQFFDLFILLALEVLLRVAQALLHLRTRLAQLRVDVASLVLEPLDDLARLLQVVLRWKNTQCSCMIERKQKRQKREE